MFRTCWPLFILVTEEKGLQLNKKFWRLLVRSFIICCFVVLSVCLINCCTFCVEKLAGFVCICMKLRNRLEEELSMSLTEFKHFIDEEMITVMRQMDAPSQIFDYLYLGSEWNASNLDELKKNG